MCIRDSDDARGLLPALLTQLRDDLGALLASRIVGESLEDDERSGRVVDRFLADLDALETSKAAATTGSSQNGAG